MNDIKLKDKHKTLVIENMKLVKFTIKRYFSNHISYWEFDEAYQWGCYGLCRAAYNWEEGKGEFSTYAVTSIKHMIERYKIRHDWGRWQVPDNPVLKPSDVLSLDKKLGDRERDGTYVDIALIDNSEVFEDIETKVLIDEFKSNMNNYIDRAIFDDWLNDYGNIRLKNAFLRRNINFSKESLARRKRQHKKAFRDFLEGNGYTLPPLRMYITREDKNGELKILRTPAIEKDELMRIFNSIDKNEKYNGYKWYYGDLRRCRKNQKELFEKERKERKREK